MYPYYIASPPSRLRVVFCCHIEFKTKLPISKMKFHVNDLKPPNAMNAIKMSNTFGSCNEENCLVAFTW